MTVSSTARLAGPFTGTGSQTVYPFAFKVFAASDLKVIQTDLANNNATQSLTGQYTVALNSDQNNNPGGNVTMLTAPPAGYLLTITSAVPATQGTNLANAGAFYPSSLTDALDRSTIQLQQVSLAVANALQLPLPIQGINVNLPAPVANKCLAWNPTANGLVNFDPSSISGFAGAAAQGANVDISSLGILKSINGGQLAGLRNRIINGDMRIDQRNSGAAVTPATGIYVIDRFSCTLSQASKLTFQQVVDAPAGFTFSEKISVAAQYSPGATDFFSYHQHIEGQNLIDLQFGIASAQAVTLTFWVKSSVAGTYSVKLQNASGARNYTSTFAVTNGWTKVSLNIPGDILGAWATDNTVGLTIFWDLGSGTNANTAILNSWVAGGGLLNFRTSGSVTFVNQTAGTTFNITGVQLELGSVATPFEQRPYGMELALCQRYYEQAIADGIGYATAGNNLGTRIKWSTPKRAIPTIAQVSNNTNFSAANVTATTSSYLTGSTEGVTVYRIATASNPIQFSEVLSGNAEL